MNLRNSMLAFFVCALVACSGGRLTPAFDGSQGAADSAQSGQLSPSLAELARQYPQAEAQIRRFAATTLACKVQKIPGTYAIVAAVGAVTGTTFASKPGEYTLWVAGKYVKAKNGPTPTPQPTPGGTPTPIFTAPPGQPLYFYLGTYALTKYGQGCAELLASENGKIIKNQVGSALVGGAPLLHGGAQLDPKTLQTGALKMRITNLNENGGKGTVQLLNPAGHGKDFDQGTITLTSRIEVKP